MQRSSVRDAIIASCGEVPTWLHSAQGAHDEASCDLGTWKDALSKSWVDNGLSVVEELKL